MSSRDLDLAGRKTLTQNCADVIDELFLTDSRVVTELDTGNERRLLCFERRLNDVLIMDDYVSVELDPSDGELIGFHQQVMRHDFAKVDKTKLLPSDIVIEKASERVERFLQKAKVSFDPGSVQLSEPELVYPSKELQINADRSVTLAYRLPVTFSRTVTGIETSTNIFVNAYSGDAFFMTPPPPG